MATNASAAESASASPSKWTRWVERLRALVRSSGLALTAMAAVAGVGAGVLVWLMSRAVQWMHVLLFGLDLNERLSGAAHIATVRLLLWPTAGGLLVGLSLWLAARWGRGPAVDPIEANALRGGRMSFRDSLTVVIQTVLSNGFGGSVGLEAGYTQAGAGVASKLGAALRLRRADMRVLVGAGAAGAIAAAFGAPLTGAFYGFEVVIGAYSVANAAPVMTAAIAGALVAQSIGGSLYHVEAAAPAALRGVDYALLLPLGAVCAALAIVLMLGVSRIERVFQHPRLAPPLRPALGGLLVGLMALASPQALSAGHGALQYDLATSQALTVLLGLLALKMLASAVSLGSGFRGGLFFASLLLGALAGQAYCQALSMAGLMAPDPTAAALVGMGAFAVAIVGGPLTMSFLVLETTGDFALTGAVLAASVLSALIVRETFGYSFSTFRFHLRGQSIRGAHDVGLIRALTVERLMRRDPPTLSAAATIGELKTRYPLGSAQRVVLTDADGRYAGMVSTVEAHATGRDEDAAASLAKLPDVMLAPSASVQEAVALFSRAESEQLAVVDGAVSRKVIGLLDETYAVRRLAEELDRSRQDLIGEPRSEP